MEKHSIEIAFDPTTAIVGLAILSIWLIVVGPNKIIHDSHHHDSQHEYRNQHYIEEYECFKEDYSYYVDIGREKKNDIDECSTLTTRSTTTIAQHQQSSPSGSRKSRFLANLRRRFLYLNRKLRVSPKQDSTQSFKVARHPFSFQPTIHEKCFLPSNQQRRPVANKTRRKYRKIPGNTHT